MSVFLLNKVSKNREISQKIKQYPENQSYFYYQNSICGISTFWENSVHPVALYFSAYISTQLKPENQCKIFEYILASIETIAITTLKQNKLAEVCRNSIYYSVIEAGPKYIYFGSMYVLGDLLTMGFHDFTLKN
jgi:hypothetical protein